MADEAPSALDRIDRALARIEGAAAARVRSNDALAHRHETLRGRIAEAIEALDAVIADGQPDTGQGES